MMKITAPNVIGTHLGWDIHDVSDGRYQPSRYASPSVYVCGDDYYCAPSGSQKPPKDFPWKIVGTYYNRPVYEATLDDCNAEEAKAQGK